MAKRTPTELRDLAKRLMNRAAEEEEKRGGPQNSDSVIRWRAAH